MFETPKRWANNHRGDENSITHVIKWDMRPSPRLPQEMTLAISPEMIPCPKLSQDMAPTISVASNLKPNNKEISSVQKCQKYTDQNGNWYVIFDGHIWHLVGQFHKYLCILNILGTNFVPCCLSRTKWSPWKGKYYLQSESDINCPRVLYYVTDFHLALLMAMAMTIARSNEGKMLMSDMQHCNM